MGAIADAIMAYAPPLIDETDGSLEQVKLALTMSQACWNLSLLPKDRRQPSLKSLAEALSMDDAQFQDLQRSTLEPMIRRHEEMFPKLHRRASLEPPHWEPGVSPLPSAHLPKEKPSQPGRYDPCPCNSGRKYKFCCGRRG